MALGKTPSISTSAPISVKSGCNTKLPEQWCWLYVKCLYLLFHLWKHAALAISSLHLHCHPLRPGYHYLLQLQPSKCSSCINDVCVCRFYSNKNSFCPISFLLITFLLLHLLIILIMVSQDVFNSSNKPRSFCLQGPSTSFFCGREGSCFYFWYA